MVKQGLRAALRPGGLDPGSVGLLPQTVVETMGCRHWACVRGVDAEGVAVAVVVVVAVVVEWLRSRTLHKPCQISLA